MFEKDLSVDYVNSRREEVIDMENAVINRNDCIIHNTYCCKSKYYKICKYLKEYGKILSSAELAGDIIRL